MIMLKWFYIIMIGLSTVATIYMIDVQRKPITRGVAVFNMLFAIGLISFILMNY